MKEADLEEWRQGHFRAIVEGSDDAIASKDLTGRILSWNPAAERMFGYTEQEAIGKRMTLIFPPDLLAEEDVILAKIARGERIDHYETVRRHKDGHLLDVSVSVSAIRDRHGRIIAASKIARDITKRKQMEADMRAYNERLQRIDHERRDFLNLVAHELRTPLTPLLFQAQLLREVGHDPERIQRALAIIERSMARLNLIVQQLLDAARLGAGRMPLDLRPLDLHALAQEQMEVYRPAAEGAGIRLRLEGTPTLVRADASRISQVIVNLLSNALKFTPRGGAVTLATRQAGNTALLEVTDTGAGFTPEQGRQLFQPFMQVHKGRSGTGLGLHISRSIAREHGGDLDATSPGPDRGATFRLRLPLAEAEATVAAATASTD